MRFKYYLRGIGIGVTLATLLLTISFYFGKDSLSKEKLTDEEIIERALELGMTMPEEEVGDTDEVVANSSLEENADSIQAAADDASTKNTAENENSEEYTLEQAIADASKDEGGDSTVTYVPFRIRGGESSEVICRNLKKSGLIDSEKEFNKYLNKLNADNAISTGNFYIPTGSSYDDIAALLVNKEIRTTSLAEGEKPPTPPSKPETPKAEE